MPKYLPGTIDNESVIRRRQQRAERRIQAANANEGTRPFQAVDRIRQNTSDLRNLVNAALNVVARDVEAKGRGVGQSKAWTQLCAVDVPVPAGRSVGVFQCTGVASLVASSVSVDVGYRLRITVAGRVIAVSDSARENVESDVWEALASGVVNLTGLSGTVGVVVQAWADDRADWPDDEADSASLAVQAAFPAVANSTNETNEDAMSEEDV
ncbi:hypothetical protein Uis1B_0622 [Bifidobacterium margollesii]|uniref:Uncharacterized protein n=1 Tax=Bifidobacterium margollesii TaxID=2020964 RepID=A0A2N5JBN9_9BIFI|nr:hypothetical protein [Bifidobacterium margollesii]PLS31630.1 hypothetical protein Uis1B_0622 [Bifidobacterium margollesii]